ncbi:2,6-dihydropseudooxynicotine hydrolase [Actinomadura rubteroloni]|uniref:2,6-dihydropseudooxynicotine hydrolase n=1 Tax=Actinomadura rubteroloni TaxID=1926885 RepID=A0A2P4UE27_9ACTN|nr:alpha/beta fold hydrolase [Actinomadura rubteroloni]POM23310.1 2,6-dihydropseudooxynicotine hydrolase [Actinomadura rubteroloni]
MTEPPWRKEAAAHQRAMPMQRLLGNGMDYADAVALYAAVDGGEPWPDAAARLGAAGAARARRALAAGHRHSALGWFRRASACHRFGQVPLPDADPRKRAMYRDLIDTYGAAGELLDPPLEHVRVPHRDGTLAAWLHRPAGVVRPPVVLLFGGFDGWREEYDTAARALVRRGLAVLLADGPGQGESRLFGGVHMDLDDPDDVCAALGAFVTVAEKHPLLGGPTGVWGNSMGGYLAARFAARDARVAAVCVNGGTDRPAEILDRFPRFAAKVQLLYGTPEPEPAVAALRRCVLTPDLLASVTCPLLVLHGTPDRIFLIESAHRVYDGVRSTDRTFLEWEDGDHCIYNHTYEKHTAVGDWFAERLGAL